MVTSETTPYEHACFVAGQLREYIRQQIKEAAERGASQLVLRRMQPAINDLIVTLEDMSA